MPLFLKSARLRHDIKENKMATKLPNPFPGDKKTTTETTTKSSYYAGNNGTLIAFVMDESGSMQNCMNETIEGFNEFINGQKQTEGACFVKVNKFEGANVVDLWGTKDINLIPEMSSALYQPKGMTNLNDAIGQTVCEIDKHLAGLPEADRPAVLVVIMTDGHENMSREYTTDGVKALIKDREKNEWAFTFLGADIDAFSASANYGMSQGQTMQYSKGAVHDAFASMSASTTRLRSAKSRGVSTEALYSAGLYTDEERTSSNGGK